MPSGHRKNRIGLISDSRICDYGCGGQAYYEFDNGKVCCSRNSSVCLFNQYSGKRMVGRFPRIKKQEVKISQLCECGCGQWTSPGKRFILGHHSRVMSKESRKKMSIGLTGIVRSTKTRKKISVTLMGHPVSVESIEKARNTRKNNLQNKKKRKSLSIPCVCGCGGFIAEGKTRNTRFLPGHNSKLETFREKAGRRFAQVNKGKSSWNKGLTKEVDSRVKSCWNKGLTKEVDTRLAVSEKTKRKQRIAALDHIQKQQGEGGQIVPFFNLRSCKFFEQFDKDFDTQGQYATNGGEFSLQKELGYPGIDYINFDLKLIIEWDEEHHYIDGNLIEKDIQRQKEIQEYFPDFLFLRIREKRYIREKRFQKDDFYDDLRYLKEWFGRYFPRYLLTGDKKGG